eukprot:Skav201467  [mRNA]  locus=scaffold663:59924:61051:+ [translate_table: standard]
MDEENEAEAELRRLRFEAYLRGEILHQTNASDADEDNENKEVDEDAPSAACSAPVFLEEELQSWSHEGAVTWILGARNSFEVLGIYPEEFPDLTSIRNRYRKLSLLVHPDKHKHLETKVTEMQATNSFQRLSEAMRVLFDDVAREQLFREIQLKTEETEEPVEIQMPVRHHWQSPDNDEQSEDSETLNEVVKDKVMQQAKLQQLLKRRKVTKKSPKAKMAKMAAGPGGGPVGGCKGLTTESEPSIDSSSAHCMPGHGAFGATPSVEKLTELWQGGSLAMAGWKRIESRRCPGQFYFAHVATGKTVMDTIWERRQSRNDPNIFYLVNLVTGQTFLESQSEKDPLLATNSKATKEEQVLDASNLLNDSERNLLLAQT